MGALRSLLGAGEEALMSFWQTRGLRLVWTADFDVFDVRFTRRRTIAENGRAQAVIAFFHWNADIDTARLGAVEVNVAALDPAVIEPQRQLYRGRSFDSPSDDSGVQLIFGVNWKGMVRL